jgi:hypothetical protein
VALGDGPRAHIKVGNLLAQLLFRAQQLGTESFGVLSRMASHISESDWRQFKRVHDAVLQRFCARCLEELALAATATTGTAHERYLVAFELLQRRNKEMALAFDDFRRSTAVVQLAIMRRMHLLTDEDLSAFSAATQAHVHAIESIGSAEPTSGDE